MNERDDARESDELLAAVVAGDVAMDDPRVQALPKAALERLAKLMALLGDLDAAGKQERALLAEVERDGDRDTVAPVARPSSFWLRAAGAAALAAGLLLVVQAVKTRLASEPELRPGPRVDGTLGTTAKIELLQPKDGVAELRTFRWRGELPPLGRFVFTIWSGDAATPAERGAPLLVRELATPSFEADAATPALPDRITWRVDVKPLEGALTIGPEAKAWRAR